MKAPRFTIRQLFASTALIAIGLALIVYLLRVQLNVDPPLNDWVAGTLWLIGGTLLGAGVLTPIDRALIGASVGLFVQLVLLCGVIAVMSNFAAP